MLICLDFNPFTPKSDRFKFPLQPHQKYYTMHSVKSTWLGKTWTTKRDCNNCWCDHVSQMLNPFAMCTTFVADTNLEPWTQKNVSENLQEYFYMSGCIWLQRYCCHVLSWMGSIPEDLVLEKNNYHWCVQWDPFVPLYWFLLFCCKFSSVFP